MYAGVYSTKMLKCFFFIQTEGSYAVYIASLVFTFFVPMQLLYLFLENIYLMIESHLLDYTRVEMHVIRVN